MPIITHTPNDQEQLLLEYLNRLRMDPGGEFDRLITNAATGTAIQANITSALSFFGVSLDAFRSQMAAYPAVAPLAWNGALAQASETHTLLMIERDEQSHQLDGEPTLGVRVTNAGYTGWNNLRENVFAFALDPLYGHAGFVIDWGYDQVDFQNGTLLPNWKQLGDGIQDPPGHRNAMLDPALTEVGMAFLAESDPATSVGPFLITQNFGTRAGYKAQLLGVVIDDRDGDSFYDIGEGLGGVTVTATGAAGTFTTTSWSSGGYQIELPAGSYNLSFSGGLLGGVANYNVTISSANVKLDAFSRDAVPNLRLLGSSDQQDILNGGRGNDVLYGDGYRASYDLDEAKAVYRLFQATLAREPGTPGLAGWTELLATGASNLPQVAAGFVNSVEFQTVYGALSNQGFVEQLFLNVLGRPGAAAGIEGWTNTLDAGTSRAQVVVGFSESLEFRNGTNARAEAFVLARDPAIWQDDVYRLFQATLDREPNINGFKAWTESLGNGTPLLTVVANFVNSPEFQTKYGALSNQGFVEQLFLNVLDRPGLPAGIEGWTNALDGGMSRAQVVQGFLQSGEFITATTPAVKAWIRAQGQDDVLEGGAGSNDLWGGAGADVFRFDRADAGSHRVHDFEAWDYLEFRAFGYTDAADVRANMTQQGADVVFADQGTTITLANTQLATIDNDTFIF